MCGADDTNDNAELSDAERLLLAMDGADIIPGAKVTKCDGLVSVRTERGWDFTFVENGTTIRLVDRDS